MNKNFAAISSIWVLTIFFGILSATSISSQFANAFVLACGGFLSIFYFYGSAYYFLQLPLKSFRADLQLKDRKLKFLSLFLGIPFALASISIIFLVLEFPGGIIVYALSIFTWLILYAFVHYGFQKSNEHLNFIRKNLNVFLVLSIFILIITVLKWPSSAIEMKWVEPTTIPGM